jgi:TrmH family RNA methyltransferase
MITSTRNERVKYVRSLARRRVRQREGRFLVEGNRLVGELVEAGLKPTLALYTAPWAESAAGVELLPALDMADQGAWLVSEAVLAACAGTKSPQGVVAVAPFVASPRRQGLWLVLDQVRDPGNLGTILRSAEAAGVGWVLLMPGTADLYNPKVVRSAMGAHFRIPVTELDWLALADLVGDRAVWLADAGSGLAYDAVDWAEPVVVILGGEAFGAGEHASELATGRVCIPMAAGAESLNVAMAATVILFEASRQRRIGSEGKP